MAVPKNATGWNMVAALHQAQDKSDKLLDIDGDCDKKGGDELQLGF